MRIRCQQLIEADVMSDLWYVRRRDQIKGPFKASIIAQFIAGHRIQESDELSVDRVQWQPLTAVQVGQG